ncbi:MAG: FkbM family methyltransferase [Nanoarchaeota archaeon]|nr:FkbM family methyltransferase [Nanoarchaeota archaeon]
MKKYIYKVWDNLPAREIIRDRIFWPLGGALQDLPKGNIRDPLRTTLKLMFGKEKIQIRLRKIRHPIALRPGTSDVPLLYHIFVEKEYSIKPKKEPAFIIDAGANIGFTAVYFANRFPKARIIAIEPEESNFRLLQKNTRYYPHISCVKAGLWNSKTLLRITNLEKDSKWGFQVEETTGHGPGTCQAISINSILSQEKIKEIDIAKIDIEGSEKELFEKNCQWLPKTNLIVIEFHDRIRPGSSQPFWDAVKGMKFKRYKKRKNIILVKE